MDWLLMLKGVVAILAVTALTLYTSGARYRSAARFRAKRLIGQEDRDPP
jgi:hypothetical protein